MSPRLRQLSASMVFVERMASGQRWLVAGVVTALLLAGCARDDDEPVVLPAVLVVTAPAQAEPGTAVQFGSSAATTAGITYRWEFGDGSGDTVAAPTHLYAQPGRYRISLAISNSGGETRSAEFLLRIGRFAPLQDARCVGAERTGWCQQWPLDSAREITPLFVRAGMQAYGAGSDGRIYHADPASATWQEARLDTPARTIWQIAFADAVTGWALGITAGPEALPGSAAPGRAALLLKTADAGRTWIRLDLKGLTAGETLRLPGATLRVLDRDHLVLTDANRTARWVSSDGGVRWASAPSFDDLVYPRSGNSLWSLVQDPDSQEWVLRRSRDLGLSFHQMLRLPASETIAAVTFADDLNGWIMTTVKGPELFAVRERFRVTRDGGASWAWIDGEGLLRSPLHLQPPLVQFFDANRGVASNWHCGMLTRYDFLRTVDAGRSWIAIAAPPGVTFQDLTVVSATAAWTSGRIRCSRGSLPPGTPPPILSAVHLTRDLGQTWQRLEVPSEPADSPVTALQIAEDQSIHLTYTDKTYRSADAGNSWARIWPAATTRAESVDGKHAVAFANPSIGMAVSASGQVMRSTDGGRSWAATVPSLALSDPYAPNEQRKAANQRGRIQLIDPSRAWLAGRDGIHRFSEVSGEFPEQLLATGDGTAARDLQFIDAGRGWVLKSSYFDTVQAEPFRAHPPRIWTTADGGKAWQEQARLEFQPHGLHFADPRLGLVVGESGAVLRTVDGGQHWSRSVSGSTNDLRRVQFVDPTTAWAVGAPGSTILVTRDAGLSWQQVAVGSPHAWNGLYFINSLRGWVVGDFGSIASTRDGGRSWQLQTSGTTEHLFDVFALDAETAWAVGERGVIRATATGGD